MIIDYENTDCSKKLTQEEMYKFLVKRYGRDPDGKPYVAKILSGNEIQRLDTL